MQGQLVRTIKGQWITRPPARCPNGHPLGPNQVLVAHRLVSGTAAGTQPGRAAMRRDGVRAAAQHPNTVAVATSLQVLPLGDPGADETTPEGCRNVAPMKSGTPNFRVLYRQADPMPTGPQAKDVIARRSVSHRKMMTMRLPYLRRNRACVRHGGIDCSCCANWGWLVLGCGCGWGVHSCGSSRPRVAGVGARAAVPYVAA
jgi:hypothetical protein